MIKNVHKINLIDNKIFEYSYSHSNTWCKSIYSYVYNKKEIFSNKGCYHNIMYMTFLYAWQLLPQKYGLRWMNS